jgi:H+/Cl- antiporter ClcA
MYRNRYLEQISIFTFLVRWTLLVIPVAVVTGSAVALFLWLLELVTHTRWQHPWLLYLLPLAGIVIYLAYRYLGGNSEKGNNLLIDEIHEPGGGVPGRMAPLVLGSTIITHLFGGSAGREGTAVQMGGSIAGVFGRWFRLSTADTRLLLMAGIAAGFGAVFGTPLTGTLFAMEVLAIGKLQYDALLPCLVAAVAGDATCAAWGIHHTAYHIGTRLEGGIPALLQVQPLLLVKVITASAAFGLAAFLFATITHRLKNLFRQIIPIAWLVPVAGGALVIAGSFLLHTGDYLGLGVTGNHPGAVSIVQAFQPGGAHTWSWLWKLLFTAVTLSSGFKGGEVTPLFFIGATLGNTLAVCMNAPVDLFAALGFIAVFAGATNTPLSCTVMGIELFGGSYVLYFAIACFTAYFFSGNTGIYSAQRIAVPKTTQAYFSGETSLQQAQERRNAFRRKLLQYWKSKWKTQQDQPKNNGDQ